MPIKVSSSAMQHLLLLVPQCVKPGRLIVLGKERQVKSKDVLTQLRKQGWFLPKKRHLFV